MEGIQNLEIVSNHNYALGEPQVYKTWLFRAQGKLLVAIVDELWCFTLTHL